MKVNRTPLKRFGEFNSQWNTEKLDYLVTWASGGTPSKSVDAYWNGEIPWISASSMRGLEYSDSEIKITAKGLINGSKLARKGNLLLLVRGSMLFNKIPIGIAACDVSFNQDVKSLACNADIHPRFLLYWFYASEHKLMNMVVGTGIGAGKLDLQDLKLMDVVFPALTEQQKIASFLTTIDDKIQQLSKRKALLEQYKKGVMQQLFSQQLRFKDDQGNAYPDWEEKQLKDVLIESKTRNVGTKVTEVFSVAKHKGVINQIAHLGRSYASTDISNYKVAEPNDIIYTKSPTSDFPYGIIKQNKTQRCGVVSVLYAVLRPLNKHIGSIIDSYFLSSVNNYNYLNPLVQKGAKNTMNIGNGDFLNGAYLSLPTSELEQAKIANFLSAIDDKINGVSQQIDHTRHFKKGLLQQMFI